MIDTNFSPARGSLWSVFPLPEGAGPSLSPRRGCTGPGIGPSAWAAHAGPLARFPRGALRGLSLGRSIPSRPLLRQPTPLARFQRGRPPWRGRVGRAAPNAAVGQRNKVGREARLPRRALCTDRKSLGCNSGDHLGDDLTSVNRSGALRPWHLFHLAMAYAAMRRLPGA
jgi:hypothetical protein